MALRTGTNDNRPAQANEHVVNIAAGIKREVAVRQPALSRPTVNIDVLISALYGRFFEQRTMLQRLIGVPGLNDAAIADTRNPTYDQVAEVTALISKLTEVINWITANVPISGWYSYDVGTANGISQVTMTKGQVTGLDTLLTELDALIA